jgi:acetyl esterase/lipase
MHSGRKGFLLGVVLTLLLVFAFQILVIWNASPDFDYRFTTYVFEDKEFPWSYLDQGRAITRPLFPVRVKITYYDAQYNEVTEADKPGRYGAVVRIGLNGGFVQYRYLTLFRTPKKVFWSNASAKVSAELPPGTGIDPVVLQKQGAAIGQAFKDAFTGDGNFTPSLAILLAGLYETSPNNPPMLRRTNYDARNAKWWFGLRDKLGLTPKYNYLIDLPREYNDDTSKKWPLILFLHGGGLQGRDPEKIRLTGLAQIDVAKNLPAIVLSPQLPWFEPWQPAILMKLIDDISAKYRVDTDRIYVTGLSLGGDATWDLAMNYPDRFAAIVPIAGEGDFDDAARIKDIPTWTFEGLKDKIVNPDNVIGMVDALRKVGGHPHLTLYPDVGHNSWDPAYASDSLYTWLFAQKRGQPEVLTPGLPPSP